MARFPAIGGGTRGTRGSHHLPRLTDERDGLGIGSDVAANDVAGISRGADPGLAPLAPPRVWEARRDDEQVDALLEVPAAVLCATCGDADCPGCGAASDGESGILAIVPWERKGAVWTRLWATASATTHGAEAFFTVLPDGEIPPAMRFALLAELLAVGSIAVILAPTLALAFPAAALAVLETPASRALAIRAAVLGVPLFAGWMVLAHATHGAALDVAARRYGDMPAAANSRRRAVRFGLYACGWDLMSGPLGAVVTLVTRGTKLAIAAMSLGVRSRTRATRAFLRAFYDLPEPRAQQAARVGLVGVASFAAVTAAFVAALGAR